MFLRDIFGKSTFKADFSFLNTDVHCHVLPGLDDGAESPEQSMFLISSLRGLGFENLVATPHILSDLYPNNKYSINSAWKLMDEQQFVKLSFAAEYMVERAFDELIDKDEILSFDDKYVLIEMSYVAESPNIWNAIFDLKVKGYQPILAHPERYNFYYNQRSAIFKKFKDSGCLLQMNLLSITGYYGKMVRTMALELLESGLYDFAGSDAHHGRHIQALQGMRRNDWRILSEYPFRNSSIKM